MVKMACTTRRNLSPLYRPFSADCECEKDQGEGTDKTGAPFFPGYVILSPNSELALERDFPLRAAPTHKAGLIVLSDSPDISSTQLFIIFEIHSAHF